MTGLLLVVVMVCVAIIGDQRRIIGRQQSQLNEQRQRQIATEARHLAYIRDTLREAVSGR